MKRLSTFIVFLCLSATIAFAQPQSTFIDAGRGSVRLYYPSDYDGSQPLPLIVGLHGFTGNGAGLEGYFNLATQIEERQFLYAIPDGTRNLIGLRFWNATDACCGTGVDDSTYLRDLVELVQRDYAVDDRSIHFTGHSNGGFMSHRMAIDHADLVASIASLAGANYLDAAAHDPSESVHVLQIHGTADGVINYNGGTAFGPYPGAEQTMLNWAGYNGMEATAEVNGDPFNLDGAV
ncbi:MAG: PHB depolymerase family esterase, partial [Planctomycetota bacterium]